MDIKKTNKKEQKEKDAGSESDSSVKTSVSSCSSEFEQAKSDGDADASKFFRKRPRTQAEDESSSSDETLTASASKIPTSSRGNGRFSKPSRSTGKGRGLTAAKTAQQAGKPDEEERPKVAKQGKAAPTSGQSESDSASGSFRRRKADFVEAVEAAIKDVSLKRLRSSKAKANRSAKDSILAAAEKANMYGHSPDKVTRLQEQVARLVVDMEALRKENEILRAELACSKAVPTQAHLQSKSNENEVVRLVRQELAAFQARFSVLEGIVLRPPLASNKKTSVTKSYAAAAAQPETSSHTGCIVVTSTEGEELRLARTSPIKRPSAVRNLKTPAAKGSPAAPFAANGAEAEWQVVGQRKKIKKAEKRKAWAERRAAKRAAARLRTPKSAAVIMTLHPEAEKKGVSYRDVLTKARAAVNLEELGIAEGLKFRVTATGARLLEIPGTSSGPTADALAEKLRASFNAEELKVSRPSKCVEMRIMGLDDSVSAEEVAAAIAKTGDCPADQIRAGAIHPGPNGMGAVVVSCPVGAANKVVESRRLLVGWVSAQIKLLEPKPLRCYRCHVGKHVGVKCTSEVDCSDRCFRCGQPGHKAGSCKATPHCIFCAANGKPAEHRAGSKACAGPAKAKGKKVTTFASSSSVAKGGPSKEASREVAMESQ